MIKHLSGTSGIPCKVNKFSSNTKDLVDLKKGRHRKWQRNWGFKHDHEGEIIKERFMHR